MSNIFILTSVSENVLAIDDLWILGDRFVKEAGDELYNLRKKAITNQQEQPYFIQNV